jgi:hypothetical protein
VGWGFYAELRNGRHLIGLSNQASAPLKHLELRDPGLLGADFLKSGPEKSMGKEMKLESGGFESAEVGV